MTQAAGERRFIEASNRLFDTLLFEDRPTAILESFAQIMGETLGVDRSLIYDISFAEQQADALVEWLNPSVPDLPPTKAIYPLELFRATADHVWKHREPVMSYADERYPLLVRDGAADLLHGTMQIQALLWCPFSFREDGYYVLVFNQVACARRFDAGEIELVQAATRHVGMALLKIELIRQKARAEEELLAAQKLESLGVLAGGIAHDFNNLMVGVVSNTELAARRLPPDSPVRQLVLDAGAAGQRAAELASQLLAYAGKGPPGVTRTNVGEVVGRTARLLQASMPDVRQDLRVLDDLPAVDCNVSQLEQIVMNLMINAAEAMDGERHERLVRVRVGTLELDAEAAAAYGPVRPAPGAFVAITVSDQGTGMDPETIARIFDPFFTTKLSGRGLGLSAVLGIVKRHRGAIQIDSAPGRGTTFTVLLPVADKQHTITAALPGPMSSIDGRSVLVIDDMPEVARAIESVLGELGFSTQVAHGGRDGLEQFRTHAEAFDCVLLDMTMPAPGGIEVMRQLRLMRSEIPIVLMSGYSEADPTVLVAAHTTFVKKPFLAEELQGAIRRVLDRV